MTISLSSADILAMAFTLGRVWRLSGSERVEFAVIVRDWTAGTVRETREGTWTICRPFRGAKSLEFLTIEEASRAGDGVGAILGWYGLVRERRSPLCGPISEA